MKRLPLILILAGGCGKATPPTQIGGLPPVADRPNVNAYVAFGIHVGEEHAASQELLGEYSVSAYCPCAKCCGKWADHITADGTDTRTCQVRIVAAPRDIPFGTVLHIEGLGKVVVHDRGGVIKGKHLDLFFLTHQAALEWGRQTRKVWRLKQ